MPTLRVPALMKTYLRNQMDVDLQGETVNDALENLIETYPAIRVHIMDRQGALRRYVNLFVNSTNINDLNGLQTPLSPEDKIILLPSISGG